MKRSSKYRHHKYGQRTRFSAHIKEPERMWRLHLVRIFLFMMCAVIIARLVQVQIVDHDKYNRIAEEQYLREYVQKAQRGRIYDRNFVTLALNKPSFDLGIDTRFVTDADVTAKKISTILKMSYTEIYNKIKSRKGFVYLKRKISEEQATIFQSNSIPGVKVIKMSERSYPLKEKVAQVIGFVNVDGNGLSGLELKMNDALKGQNGWSIQQKDAKGKTVVPVQAATKVSEDGEDIVLTIDNVIQTIAEEELQKTVRRFHAKSASVVITNPMTGEILALASVPVFDPNSISRSDSAAWRLRPITDIFEPGSTFKLVTLLAALQDSIKAVDDIIFCENGHFNLFGERINDSEEHGWLSVRNIMKYSSNIGMAKIALDVGKKKLFKTSRSLGFGLRTGINLPGEVSGILKKPTDWSAFSVAAIAYGHEVAATSLQMAMAYGAAANGGKLMKPAIIKEIIAPNHQILFRFQPKTIRQVMKPQLAHTITDILEEVVEDGTGVKANIKGLRIAGKTGTAQKPLKNGTGYSNSRYMASFAGFYPADHPKYMIFINVDEPHPTHSGGSVAGPAFKKILQRILKVYNDTRPEAENFLTQTEKISRPKTVPNLHGRNVETAIKLLNEMDKQFKIIGHGLVVESQKTEHQKNGTDLLVLKTRDRQESKAIQVMPNLIGLSLRNAVSECSLRGLKVRVFGTGDVISQKPKAGSKIKTGAQIMLECRLKHRMQMIGKLSMQQTALSEN